MASSNSKNVKSLSKQLASVAKQAKSLGINTSKADAMVKQTNREGGKSFSGSKEEKAYTAAIPMTALQPTDVANIPEKPTPVDYGAVAPPTPVTTSTVEQGFQNNQNWLNTALQSAYDEVGTGESRLAKLEKDNQLKQKEQAVNNATEQLNQIVAKQQQDLISTRGTASANGVTEAVYGGISATINREAALQALPVQAQLAAAQNNLEMAQTHIDRMYAIQSQDAQAKYQYKTKVIESIYNYANASQQRQLDQLNIQEERKYDEKKTNIAYQRDLAAQAIEYGQTSLAGSIMRRDPNSPTYADDLATDAARLSKPVVATKRDTSFNSNGDLVDMQTGEVISKATDSGLNDETRKAVMVSPEYKTISGVIPAIQALTTYKDLITQYGTSEKIDGAAKGKLDAAYGNALVAWKSLAALGALSGADFGLAENAVPAPSFWTRQSVQLGKVQGSIDNGISQAEALTNRLIQVYPEASELLQQQLDDMRASADPESVLSFDLVIDMDSVLNQ